MYIRQYTTYHLVVVVELQYNIRGVLSNVVGISVNLHITENQSLVPRWVQCRSQLLRCLTEMQEGDVCVWICEGSRIVGLMVMLSHPTLKAIFAMTNFI